jgi:E3 Ubiquitin ligase
VTACLSFFIPRNHLTILAALAIAGGLYFLFVGFRLLSRKRLLLATPTSRIRSAAPGLVEVNGMAAGPYTMTAPITGKPCFLYHATVWQKCEGKKEEWEKVADETLHLPFFVDDSTGQLLIEPLGADLDLHPDFREDFDASFFSSSPDDVPSRITGFLSRHGVAPSRQVRIEELTIKPDDALFVAGTLTENPGVQVRPLSPRKDSTRGDRRSEDSPRNSAPDHFSEQLPAPQIIRLQGDAPASRARDMSQQAKIAAALTRAGISKPEAWSVAGVTYQAVAVEEDGAPAPVSGTTAPAQSSNFVLTPPVVLMKGSNDSTFVISFRSQKEFVIGLAWKSAAMLWGGAAIGLVGIYTLMLQMGLL